MVLIPDHSIRICADRGGTFCDVSLLSTVIDVILIAIWMIPGPCVSGLCDMSSTRLNEFVDWKIIS